MASAGVAVIARQSLNADAAGGSSLGGAGVRPRAALTPGVMRALLDDGVGEAGLVRLLVATGAWTERGALDIIQVLTGDAAALPTVGDGSLWPGPIDDAPPLFA